MAVHWTTDARKVRTNTHTNTHRQDDKLIPWQEDSHIGDVVLVLIGYLLALCTLTLLLGT